MNLFKEYEVKPSSKAKTYHKLTVNRGKIEPPEAVKNSTNCRNIPQCLINASIVDYDIVDWSRSPEGTKIHIHFIISPDVPQLARILESCQQGSIPVPQPGDDSLNPPRLLVTLCDTVSDFIPGQL